MNFLLDNIWGKFGACFGIGFGISKRGMPHIPKIKQTFRLDLINLPAEIFCCWVDALKSEEMC